MTQWLRSVADDHLTVTAAGLSPPSWIHQCKEAFHLAQRSVVHTLLQKTYEATSIY